MTWSTSLTEVSSFTVTHARHIASKVATDLLRFHRFYGFPSIQQIDDYEAELVALFKHNYLKTITYGLKRNGLWVEAVRYRAVEGGSLVRDDDPGKLRPGIDMTGVHFTSFLDYSTQWLRLSEEDRERFQSLLPFRRAAGSESGVENGYWAEDLTYSSGGRGLTRSVVKRF